MGRRQTIDPFVRAKVIETWGNDCWLRLPGCTRVGTEDDHIVPHSHGGMDTVPNIRRACKHCNASRQDRVLYGYGARLHMIVVPPGSCDREAVDYIDAHKNAGDPVVSFSALAAAMGLTSPSLAARRAVAMAWSGAYRQFAISSEPIDVWCTRTTPSSKRHPRMMDEWIALDYDVRVIDPASASSGRGRRTTLPARGCGSGTRCIYRKPLWTLGKKNDARSSLPLAFAVIARNLLRGRNGDAVF